MTMVLDAAALIALMRDEPAAGRVATVLAEGSSAITAINFGEVVDVVVRQNAMAPAEARRALGRLTSSVLAIIPVDESLAWRAATLRAEHYHRREAPVSLSDCACLAAVGDQDTVLTSDGPMLRIAAREGIRSEALPDSHGRTAVNG